jgi:glycosyltransferase involved in cell wall biosynthesis
MPVYTFYEGDNRVRRYAEALVKRGDTVDIIACGKPGQPFRDTLAGVTVFRIQTRVVDEKRKIDYFVKIISFFIRSSVFLTWRHLWKHYRLIHVHSVPDFEVFAAFTAKLAGAKLILDIHDIVPEFYAGKFNAGKNTILSKVLMLVEKLCCAFADHVIIANHIWQKTLISRSTKKEKCSVMLNYPDPSIFKGDFPRNRSDTFSMIYPGTLSKHQGLDVAIRALALVKETLGPFRFNIYGRGVEEQSLKDLSTSLHLETNILFNGIYPLEAIAEKMALSDLGVVPKRADDFGNEAFSTKIFEFMALNVPVLISSTKVDRYYFDESVVMFFESGNERELSEKILFLAKSRKFREELAARASEFVKQYSWDVNKDDYFRIVDGLTANRGGKSWLRTPNPYVTP